MELETVIGLEVHAELMTNSKMYCGCSKRFGQEENTLCCPVCAGFPGALPRLNAACVEACVRAGIALNCEINSDSHQDRKHYFYPDLPKAYQTSQFDQPLCKNGFLDVEVNGEMKRIGITRIHIEEDAGKLVHEGKFTRIDLNRSGVGLIEIVTEADFRSADEAYVFLHELRAILIRAKVCNGRMQEGALRADINLSVREKGSDKLGTRTEMKNLNSFSAAKRAIDWESKRQKNLINEGKKVCQDTLRWDDHARRGIIMRKKESQNDYLFYADAEIPPIRLSENEIKKIRETLPEMPAQRSKRYEEKLNLSRYDARELAYDEECSDLFEECVALNFDAKKCANLLLGDLRRLRKDSKCDKLPINANQLGELLKYEEERIINKTAVSKVMDTLFDEENHGKMPREIIDELSLAQMNDEKAIYDLCEQVINDCEKAVADYLKGKEKAFGALLGQVMRRSEGRANADVAGKALNELIAKQKYRSYKQ